MRRLRTHAAVLTMLGFLMVQAVCLTWTTRGIFGEDFAVYYLASRALQQGRNIYTLSDADWAALAAAAQVVAYQEPYLYPPLIAGVLRPIAPLPFTTALLLWRIGTIGALLVTALCLSQFLRQRWVDPLVFAGAAFFIPALTTLYAGQANTLVLAALAAWLLLDQRHRVWWSGIALAFSLLIKPLSIALAVYLVWRRAWKRLAALVVGIAIGGGVMLIVAGLPANLDYLHSIFAVIPSSPTAYPPNQSVFGFFARLLTTNEYAPALANLPAVGYALALFAAGALILLAAYLTWPRRRPDTFALGAGLVLVTFSLIAPASWYHHAVIDLIPLLLAWFATSSRTARGVLLMAYVLIDVQGLFWKAFEGQTLLLSLGLYGLLLIYAVLVWLLWLRPVTAVSSVQVHDAGVPIRQRAEKNYVERQDG